MTRAEEAALKAYPPKRKEVSMSGCVYTVVGGDFERRIYQQGYEQAEKDLGWISIEDRLPEEGHFVLICVSDAGTPQCVGMALLLEDGTWWDGDVKVRVDYWMEVPKLPKEEQK